MINIDEKDENNLDLSFLFSATIRQHNIWMNQVLKPYNISASEFPLLMKLHYNELFHSDIKITQHNLAEEFYLTEGTIARSVRKLEDKGFIQRQVDDNNRRKKYVSLTPQGHEIALFMRDLEEKWEVEVIRELEESEKENLKQILKKIASKSFKIKDIIK